MKLSNKISTLPTVGPKTAASFTNLGLKNLKDLLYHLPVSYQDLSKVTKIAALQTNQLITIKATLQTIANRRAHRRRLTITEALAEDGSNTISLVWFNQPFLEKSLQAGNEYYFSGKAIPGRTGWQLTSPAWEPVKTEQTHAARIVPVYSLSGKLTSKRLRFLIKKILPLSARIPDWLPPEVRSRQRLLPFSEALNQIHFPDSIKSQKLARRRLAFDELFLIQLIALSQRQELTKLQAPSIPFDEKLVRNFVSDLGFTLTNGQRRSVWEILQDLTAPRPMNRLLNGDVGSGKTLVATIALLEVAKADKQAVLMAPTEVLARQHFLTLTKDLAANETKIGLLTNNYQLTSRDGKTTTPQNIHREISRGRIKIIIGTHALIQEKVVYEDLALVVIDEQHRFGVKQRQALTDKTPDLVPHFLSMTATPIPRTLALTLYGDLDISIIDSLPQHRLPIKTFYIPPAKREETYKFIRSEIKNGRQAFVITPLIEESDKLGVRAATAEYENLQGKIFPDLKIGLLHGRQPAAAKEKTMSDFQEGRINILVATAVVEVGIDIPNATVMMIEGADRFGLAQLHQFRGRVGRGRHQSYCFLLSDSAHEAATARLGALIRSRDGFALAEKDLAQRGPGEVFGTRQSGLPDIQIADLTDLALIKSARQEAKQVFAAGFSRYPRLQAKIRNFRNSIHWE